MAHGKVGTAQHAKTRLVAGKLPPKVESESDAQASPVKGVGQRPGSEPNQRKASSAVSAGRNKAQKDALELFPKDLKALKKSAALLKKNTQDYDPNVPYDDRRNAELFEMLKGRYEQLDTKTRRSLDGLVGVMGFDDYLDFVGVLKEFLVYIYDVSTFHPVKHLKEMITQTLQQVLQQRLESAEMGQEIDLDFEGGATAEQMIEVLNALPGDVLQKLVDGASPDILWDVLFEPGNRPAWMAEPGSMPAESGAFKSAAAGVVASEPDLVSVGQGQRGT